MPWKRSPLSGRVTVHAALVELGAMEATAQVWARATSAASSALESIMGWQVSGPQPLLDEVLLLDRLCKAASFFDRDGSG